MEYTYQAEERYNGIINKLHVLAPSKLIENIKNTNNLKKTPDENFEKEYLALLGAIISEFIPKTIANIINIIIGIFVIFYGIKIIIKKKR